MAQSITLYLGSDKNGNNRFEYLKKKAGKERISVSALIQKLIDKDMGLINQLNEKFRKDMENKEVKQ